MDTPLIALYVVGFFVVIFLINYGVVVKRLLAIRFKQGDCELHDIAELPSHLTGIFDSYGHQLAELGFGYSHCQLVDELIVTALSKKWNVVYFNPAENFYANVSLSSMPDQNTPAKVEMVTFFSDGSKLLTLNGFAHEIVDKIPNVILRDPYPENLEKQFQAHREELARLQHNKRIITLEPGEYVGDEKKSANDYFNHLHTNGFIRKTSDSNYRLRFGTALRTAYTILKGAQKQKAMKAKIRKWSHSQNIPLIHVPVEVEVEAFTRTQDILKPKKTEYTSKMIIFLVSMVLFIFAFRMSFSFDTVLVILAAIFIHELGHVLGMRLFKYKDVQVLFLPFIGGATIGNEKDASALQRIIVYLLGPAPGIILGTVCLWLHDIYDIKYLYEFGLFLLILNYINMLPLLPLDGGRVFELALFSRFWFLKIAFWVASIVILVLGAIYLGDPILIGFSILLGISLWWQVKQSQGLAKLNKKIKAENLDTTEAALLPAIFRILKAPTFNKLMFAQKFQLAKYMLNNTMKKPITIGASVLGMFLYGLVLILPLLIVAGGAVSQWDFGTGSNYTRGVLDFHPSPDEEKVLISGSKHVFNSYCCILDKNGSLITHIKNGSSYFDPKLVWRPGNQHCCVLYQEEEKRKSKKSLFDAPIPTHPIKVMYNVSTDEKTILQNQVECDDETYCSYYQWSEDGTCLLGTTMSYSENACGLVSVFRQNVSTGVVDEVDMTQLDTQRMSPLCLTKTTAYLENYDNEDYENRTLTVVHFDSRDINTYSFSPDISQWVLALNDEKLVAVKKLFVDNNVSFQIVQKSLKSDDEKILMADSELPQYSFEDAARGKQAFINLDLSPSGKWVICTVSTMKNPKTIKWLIDPVSSNHFKMLDSDDDQMYPEVIFNKGETMFCAVYSSSTFDDDGQNKKGFAPLDIYDITNTGVNKVKQINGEPLAFNYKFFGNDRLLYIKASEDVSRFSSNTELWTMTISDGQCRPFVPRNTSSD